MIKSLFLTLSIIAGFSTPTIGIYTMLKSDFRPQRMTRFLIMLISLIFFGTLYAQGDTNGIWIALAQVIGSTIIFILSIKRGIGGYGKFDLIIFLLAVLSLILWQTSHNPMLGLIMSIVTDLIAFTPTIIKMWQLPNTEEWRFYLSDLVASTFSLLSLTVYSFSTIVFPAYIFFFNLIGVSVILFRRRQPSPVS
jgi:hypothetical protein